MKKIVSILLLFIPVISNASAFLASLGVNTDSQNSTSQQGDVKPKKTSKSLATVNSFVPKTQSTDNVTQGGAVGVGDESSLKAVTKRSQSSMHVDSLVHNGSQSNKQQSNSNTQTKTTQSADVSNSADFLSSYYGNPKYKAAMNILDDSQLQTAYSQNLQSIEMQMSDYAQQMIRNHHNQLDKNPTQLEQEQRKKNIHSFLQGLQPSQPQDSVVSGKVKKAKKKRSSNVSAFLAGLKG